MRVASVPSGHPYVAGLGLGEADAVRLPDPPVPGAPPGRWWPPVMLEPAWIAAHAGDFDVMHVHFGVESLSPSRLRATVAALRAAGRPLVYTVHDLSHPQLTDQARQVAQLEILVAAADGLITLTPGAADEVAARFGRRPLVLAHPAMRGPGPLPGAAAPARSVVGVHLRDLRPGIDGPGTVALLAAALDRLPGVGGRVFLHERVRDAGDAAAVAGLCAGDPGLELIRGPRPDDAGLAAGLAGLSVSLLPYRHGTHSGWLELCWDLGVPVAGPALGHWGAQHPDPGFYAPFGAGDPGALGGALARLLAAPEAVPGSAARRRAVAARSAERARALPAIAAAHLDLYRALL